MRWPWRRAKQPTRPDTRSDDTVAAYCKAVDEARDALARFSPVLARALQSAEGRNRE